MGNSFSRRAILAASAAGASALAGCGGQGGNGGDGGGGGDEPLLSTLRLSNSTDQALTVHVVVERDEEFVHWSTQRLGPQGSGGGDGPPESTTVERTWSEDTGEFVVNARLDQRTEGRTVDLTELSGDPNCWGLELEVTQNGDFSVWTTEDPEGCPIGDGGGNES